MKPFWLVFALGSAAAVYALGAGETGAATPAASSDAALTQDAAAEATAEVTAGTVTGSIVFDGERPDPKPPLNVGAKESEGCMGEVPLEDRSLLISEKGGIANVVVSLEAKGYEVKIPEEPIVIDQIACRFEPHVQVVPAGATLKFTNSDGTNHNIHTYAKKNQNKNSNVSGGQALETKVEHAEEFETKCDIHSWMNAWVVVSSDTHYTVTDAEGQFTLADVPDGAYKLSLWHETLGKGKTAEVEVKKGAVAKITHKWSAKDDKKGGGRRRR
ncbi:MAG: carboxypeptidase regulatory-like domain-containing protein [Planctomycetota bacterium]